MQTSMKTMSPVWNGPQSPHNGPHVVSESSSMGKVPINLFVDIVRAEEIAVGNPIDSEPTADTKSLEYKSHNRRVGVRIM